MRATVKTLLLTAILLLIPAATSADFVTNVLNANAAQLREMAQCIGMTDNLQNETRPNMQIRILEFVGEKSAAARIRSAQAQAGSAVVSSTNGASNVTLPPLHVTPRDGALVVYHADEAELVRVGPGVVTEGKFRQGDTIIICRGNVIIAYESRIYYADVAEYNKESDILVAYGNVKIQERDGDGFLQCQKIIFHPDTGVGVAFDASYNAQDGNNRMYYSGGRVTISSNNSFSIANGSFTVCGMEDPHFTIEAAQAWIYSKDRITVLSAWYRIGKVRAFYIPFFYRTPAGTGIISYWGRRTTEGIFIMNTARYYYGKNAGGENSEGKVLLKFDFYQRLGEYLGADWMHQKDNTKIYLGIAVADQKIIENDQNVLWENGRARRLIRYDLPWQWKLAFNGSTTLFQAKDSGGTTTLKWNFFRMSDRYFQYNFENYRQAKPGFKFDDEQESSQGWYNYSDQNWYVSIADSRGGSSLSLQTAYNFTWLDTIDDYILTTATIPSLNYSLNGTIDPPKQTKVTNLIPTITTNIILKTNVSLDEAGNDVAQAHFVTNLMTNYAAVPTVKADPFAMNLQYNLNTAMSYKDKYDSYEEDTLISSVYNRSFSMGLSRAIPIFKWFTGNTGLSLSSQSVTTKMADSAEQAAQTVNDQNNSYTSVSLRDSLGIGPNFLRFGLSHNVGWKLSEAASTSEYKNLLNHSISGDINFSVKAPRTAKNQWNASLRTSMSMNLRTKTNENLESFIRSSSESVQEYRRRINETVDRLSNPSVTLTVVPIKLITISEVYAYSFLYREKVSEDESVTNYMVIGPLNNNLRCNIQAPKELFDSAPWLKSLSANVTWYHDFQNERSGRLTYGLNFNVELKQWKFNVSFNGQNKYLYYYNKSVAAKYETYNSDGSIEYGYRSFFADLANSINPFNTELRENSYFKMSSVNVSLTHDLHCWELTGGYTLTQRPLTIGTYTQIPYFEHEFSIQIMMKASISDDFKAKYDYTSDPPTLR